MSTIRSWSLSCDHADCNDADAFNLSRGYDTLAPLRADAKAAGWVRRDGKDFCPDHATPSALQEGQTT